MSRKTLVLALLIGGFSYASAAFAAEPNDYIIPGKSYMLEGTLSGLCLAYETFDSGINDQACPNCSTNRELVFLHAVTRTVMLFIDNNDVPVDSFLELAQPFGITLTGDYFLYLGGLIDVNYLVDVNVALDANGYYRIPPEAPNAVEIGEIVHYSIIPEINDIIDELNSISDSPSNRFRFFFEPNQTGLQNNLEVDYGEVLILKGFLLALKGQLEAKLAYDMFVDVNEELIHKLLYEDGINVNDSNVVDLFVVLDVNDPNNPNINEDFLDRYPYLLTVLPTPGHDEDGAAILAQAAQDWINAIDYYFNAIDYIRSEDEPPGTDPQEDELLYIDPNDAEVLDSINARLTTLRDSLINDTVGTYPWETSNTYYLEDPCSTITWELMLNYDIVGLPTDKPGSFVASDSNGIPSPWEVTDISIDGNEIILEMDYDVPGYWGGALFTGILSDDGNNITNGTFEYWGPDYGTLYDLSGQLVNIEVVERQFDPNPVFGSSSRYPDPLNPRDLLPEFDHKNMPISGTFGHELGDDPTLGWVLPGMTQEEWAILFDLPVPGLRFYEQLRLATGDNPSSVALGDVNGDGILDIVTANTDSNDISVLLGLGNGSFQEQARFGVGHQPESVELGDVNADGVPDIVTANSGSNDVSVLLGLGNGSFQEQARFSVGYHPVSVALGDLNGDGMLDVITANCWSANISVLLGLGNGTFRPQATFGVGYGPHSVALGDLNGDGNLDIVTADSWSWPSSVSVLLGLGDGSFQPQTTFEVGSGPHSIVLGDLNADGILDVVTANHWSGDISVLLGLGDGGFQTQARFDVGNQPQFLSLGDVNGDGVLDVVTANGWDENISILLGVGDGRFGRPSRFDVGNDPQSVVLGELNSDGALDIVTANISSNDLMVLINRSIMFRHWPSGTTVTPVDAIHVHFPHDMNTSSFSLEDDIVSFVGPQGTIDAKGFEWINPKTLEIRFESQSMCGIYQLVIGPEVLDMLGQAMDVDHDSVPGEVPDDQYVATFKIVGARIVGHSPRGTMVGPVQSLRLNFNGEMAQDTFSLADDILSFTGPRGPVTPISYRWVDSDTLEVTFEAWAAGQYTVVIGPNILSLAGNKMDQDGDFITGELPDDQYIVTFKIRAPRLVNHTPSGSVQGPIEAMRFNFEYPMDQTSFSLADDIVTFTGPDGPATATGYNWVDSGTLEVSFEPQSVEGTYEMVIGPEILDLAGNKMDQDADMVVGEVPDDQYSATFEVTNILYWSGVVTEDTTWRYTVIVDGSATVASGVTLTIEAGTIVKFKSSSEMIVNGTLKINGTPEDRVILTSLKDDTAGGDTNADGAASSPSPGDWMGIAFCNTAEMSSLEGIEIRYSSEGACVGWWYQPPSGIARLRDAILRNNSKAIVARVAYSEIEAENCLVINNSEAIAGRNTAGISLRNCTMAGNLRMGDVTYAILTIENSIFAFNDQGFRSLNLLNDLIVRNSGFYGPDAQAMLTALGEQVFRDNGNIAADPQFVDRQAGNYELSAGSPAIDVGRGVGALTTDILGRPRYDDSGMPNVGSSFPCFVDMGAYERQENTAAGDLAVTYVSDPNPEIVSAGDTFTIEWAVTNVGTLDCNAYWEDKVYLSDDPYIGSEDVTLGTYDHNGLLPSGSNYTREVNVIVPASTGPKYILVHANANNSLYEPVVMNNVLNSPSVLAVDVPTLKIGTPQTRTVSAGQWHYYRFEAQPGRTVLFTLDSSTSGCQIYLRHRLPPTISNYDATGEDSSGTTQEMRLLEPIEETYYIGVYSQWYPANYTISADLTSLNIRRVSPDRVGNAGRATLKIEGDNFDPNTQVRLVGPGGTFEGQEYYQDSATLFTTFDLAAVGATVGLYDVVVTNPDAQTVTAYNAVTIEEGGAPDFTADLSMPGRCRPGRVINLTIDYTNSSRIDVNSPILTLDSGDAECQWQLPGNDNWVTGPDFRLMALSSEGPPTILRPGQTETITVKLRVPFRPGRLTVSLSSVGAIPTDGSNEPIDWDNLKEKIRPRWLDNEAWEPVCLNLIDQVGHTWGDYAAMLRDNARYLSVLGSTVYDVASLFAFEVQQAQGLTCPRPILAEATDTCGRAEGGCSCEAGGEASAATDSLMLLFTRVYRQSLASRYTLGHLGRGWTHNWEHSVVVDEEGNVTVVSPWGPGFFRRLPDGIYTSESCSVLTLEGGLYHLTEPDGRELVFRSDGRLWYIDDEQGNLITTEYDGDRLVALHHSNGKSYTFQCDAHGRISQLTDCEAKVTTYVYDASGEHLVSVTNSDGTRRYTYATGMGLAREHALLSIEHLDGTHDYFEYDDRGRLAREHTDASDESRTYRYDTAGGVTVTDETGVRKTFFYDDSGAVRRSITVDQLGRSTEVSLDPAANSVQLRLPGGVTKTAHYDSQGNITAFTDPLGHRVELQYDPVTNRLLSVQDPRGNTIGYTYDTNGNLTANTYPDATTVTYAYDEAGNLTQTVNARGQTTRYTYDDADQLIRVDYSNSTSDTFTYDANSNLLMATDNRGTTTMQYDVEDRLIRIEYPSGRYLAFSYDDEGRRTQITDQDGFAVNYAYDVNGRLAALSDANGQAIVTYTYDTAGRVSRKDMGNGTYTTYGYDPAGQLLHVINYAPDNTVNSRFDYTYDELGRRTRMTTVQGTWTYGYDDADHLTSVTLPGGRLIEYEYDAVGNRISSTDGGVPTHYTTNNLDQYTSAGSATYAYDVDGNLRSRTEGTSMSTYSFNEINKMTQVTTSDGTWVYEYDPLGNRVATTHQGERVEYLVDPTDTVDVVAEYNSAGSLAARYIHSPFGIVGAVDSSAEIAYYDFDATGNTVGITGPAGTYVNEYSYLPFGETLSRTETIANPFTYVGQRGVMDERNGLIFIRARYYAPSEGRFLSRDPLGVQIEETNLYAYVGNNPVSLVDPTGLREVGPYDSSTSYCSTPVMSISRIPGIFDFNWACFLHDSCFGTCQNNSLFYWIACNWQFLNNMLSACSRSPWHMRAKCREFAFLYYAAVSSPIGERAYYLAQQNACGDEPPPDDTPDPNDEDQDEEGTDIQTSVSPEDKWGPAGYDTPNTPQGSELHYITAYEASQIFNYRIEIWNKPTAPVPTQDATIDDVLDLNIFDLSTFEFTRVGFLKWDVPLPGGQAVDVRVDCRPEMNIAVDITGTFDPQTGRIYWWFHCVDPMTGDYPEDPNAGFLPPYNSETGFEIGWVEFSVKPKDGLPDGTQLSNQAFVQFDFLGPFGAAPKEGPWFNTIDAGVPSSYILPLPTTPPETDFLVEWTGQDDIGGSGIAHYDIYVSIDNGEHNLWLNNTSETSAIFNGEDGHVYTFYSVAIDNVGNVEEAPAVPDAIVVFNRPPVANAGPDRVIECACNSPQGTQATLDGTDSNDPDGDSITYTWRGSFVESPANGSTPTVTLLDGCPGDYIVTLVVNDGKVESEPDHATITVQDTTLPVFTTVPEDMTVQRDGNGNLAELDAWVASVVEAEDTCGDVIITDDFTSGPDDCGNTGSVTVTWTAVDDCGNSATTSATFTIMDPTRSVTYDGEGLVSTGGVATINTNLIATLRDDMGNPLDIDGEDVTFTLTAEGVGTIVETAVTVDGVASVVLPLEPAIYMVEVTLGCLDFTASAILVVYNPEGGFATGGGWIVPEADADGFNTHPNVRANFGFNAKYKADSPTGHIEFRYSDGYTDLKSSSIEQLVITGGRIVQFKGWAWVNGVADNWFFVKAIDNGEPGVNDTFEIKIWYPGVSEEGNPSERAGGVLQGGNIVVHAKNK